MVKPFKHNRIVILFTVIILLFLTSAGINIYQHIKINEYNKNFVNLQQHYMSMHIGVFYNALYIPDTSDVQSIMDIETLSQIIEEVQKALVYYDDAKYTENYWSHEQGSDSGIHTIFLINGYIKELQSVYNKLVSNNSISNEDTSTATDAINDLKLIAEWLYNRQENSDFTIYGDRDFYENVYGKLSSNIKENYLPFKYD